MTDTPAPAAPASDTPAPAAPAARPDWAPDKFWDSAKNELRVQDLATSYRDLEGKLRTRNDDVRKAIETEFHAERRRGLPEKPDGYKLDLPDGSRLKADEKDPFVSQVRAFAHEAGINQEGFTKLLASHIAGMAAVIPDSDAEMAKLGDKAADRVSAVDLWIKANVPAKHHAAYEEFAVTAAGVELLEHFMEKLRDPSQVRGEGAGAGEKPPTLDEVRAMQRDERYWNEHKRDMAFVKKVDEAYQRIFRAA